MRINDPVTSLRLNVDELCETHMESADTAYSIDGQAVVERNTGMVPGLIQQLRDSAKGGQSGGSGGSAQNARSPLAIGMWNLLNEIGGAVSDHYMRVTRERPTNSVEGMLAGWARGAQQFPTEVERCLGLTDRWIAQIGELLNPPRRWELSHACPNCEQRWVVREADGEQTKTAALVVSKDEAVCRACEIRWEPAEFQGLAEQIGA